MLKYYPSRSGLIPTAVHPFVKPEVSPLPKPLPKPANKLRKANFSWTPYIKSKNLRTIYKALNILARYILVWILVAQVVVLSLWLLLCIIILCGF
jgi:hypothetical protein